MSNVIIHRAAKALAIYLLWASALTAIGTMIGSFVVWAFWTPLDHTWSRALVAWLALLGPVQYLLTAALEEGEPDARD